MATASNRFGLIILGNTGVGKSFLANILLGRDAFTHMSTVTSVTRKTEFHEVTFEAIKYVIFNIPGLIEADQPKIDTNKQEIDKAFAQCPNAVIIYVFGNQNGRIRSEDVFAFNALNDAYPFKDTSLVLVLNCKPPPDPQEKDYEGKTIVFLRERLDFKEWRNICFLDDIRREKINDGKQKLRDQLLPSILASMPNVHTKKHDIHLLADSLEDMTTKYKESVKKGEAEKTKSEESLRIAQEANRSTQEKYKREKEKRHKALEDLNGKQKKQEEVDARQKEQKPVATDAGNSSALQRGIATATVAGLAAAPLGPLVAAASAASGFVAGYYASN